MSDILIYFYFFVRVILFVVNDEEQNIIFQSWVFINIKFWIYCNMYLNYNNFTVENIFSSCIRMQLWNIIVLIFSLINTEVLLLKYFYLLYFSSKIGKQTLSNNIIFPIVYALLFLYPVYIASAFKSLCNKDKYFTVRVADCWVIWLLPKTGCIVSRRIIVVRHEKFKLVGCCSQNQKAKMLRQSRSWIKRGILLRFLCTVSSTLSPVPV